MKKEKKITLPLILAFKKAPTREKKQILSLIKKGVAEKEIKTIYDFANGYGW